MGCDPKCYKTAALAGPGGGRVMISQQGNPKFPTGTPHPQCPDCAASEYAELMKDVQNLKDAAVLGPGLAEKWQQIQDKAKLVLDGSKK